MWIRTSVGLALALALVSLSGCGKPTDAADAVPPSPEIPVSDVTSSDAGAHGGSNGSGNTTGGQTSPDAGLCVLGGPPAATAGETLVYAEDFNGSAIDDAKWNVLNTDRTHGALLSTFTTDMVKVHDGAAFISTDRNTPGSAFPYKGGFLDAIGKYSRTYGKYEIRGRFPFAPGVWYALWARPTTQAFPEVDIEITNRVATQVYFVDHWAAPPLPADQRRAYSVSPTDPSNPGTIDYSQFHVYTVTWKPGMLTYAIDGDVRLQTTVGVPDIPLAWKINSWAGGWPGLPTDATVFPVTFEIDYFHVYRLDGLIADPSIYVANKQSAYDSAETIDIAIADFDEACVHMDLYDGSTRIESLSAAPFSFSLSKLTKGQHALSFVATDGVRSTITSLDTVIN